MINRIASYTKWLSYQSIEQKTMVAWAAVQSILILAFFGMLVFFWWSNNSTADEYRPPPTHYTEDNRRIDNREYHNQDLTLDTTLDLNTEQEQSQTQSADTEVNITETHPDQLEIKSVGSVGLYTPPGTDECHVVFGGGTGWLGGALALNIPLPSRDCKRFRIGTWAMANNQIELGVRMICQIKDVRRAFDNDQEYCRTTMRTAHKVYVKKAEPPKDTITKGECARRSRKSNERATERCLKK